MTDFSCLSEASDIWDCWRFEPWTHGDMTGVYRRVTFIKAGLMGEVARYYADDYVVFAYDESSVESVRKNWTYAKDVMIHRFVFVSSLGFEKKIKTFALGFRGYLETYRYVPMGEKYGKIMDLTPLIDKAWESVKGRISGGGASINICGM